MAQNDLVLAHLRDTTSMVRVSKKAAKIRRATLWVLAAFGLGLFISVMQMRQRDKVDAIAVEEGKIPAITISSK